MMASIMQALGIQRSCACTCFQGVAWVGWGNANARGCRNCRKVKFGELTAVTTQPVFVQTVIVFLYCSYGLPSEADGGFQLLPPTVLPVGHYCVQHVIYVLIDWTLLYFQPLWSFSKQNKCPAAEKINPGILHSWARWTLKGYSSKERQIYLYIAHFLAKSNTKCFTDCSGKSTRKYRAVLDKRNS